jgi:hypothetical protein
MSLVIKQQLGKNPEHPQGGLYDTLGIVAHYKSNTLRLSIEADGVFSQVLLDTDDVAVLIANLATALAVAETYKFDR